MARHIVTFFDDGATFPYSPNNRVEAWQDEETPYWSRAYFCPCCGHIWARWESESAEFWRAVVRACPHHLYFTSERSGSLLEGVNSELALLSPTLLVREFFLGDAMQLEIRTLSMDQIAAIPRWDGGNKAFFDPLVEKTDEDILQGCLALERVYLETGQQREEYLNLDRLCRERGLRPMLNEQREGNAK